VRREQSIRRSALCAGHKPGHERNIIAKIIELWAAQKGGGKKDLGVGGRKTKESPPLCEEKIVTRGGRAGCLRRGTYGFWDRKKNAGIRPKGVEIPDKKRKKCALWNRKDRAPKTE